MATKHISFIYMYKLLLVYVSVSLNSQWGLTAHDSMGVPGLIKEDYFTGV